MDNELDKILKSKVAETPLELEFVPEIDLDLKITRISVENKDRKLKVMTKEESDKIKLYCPVCGELIEEYEYVIEDAMGGVISYGNTKIKIDVCKEHGPVTNKHGDIMFRFVEK